MWIRLLLGCVPFLFASCATPLTVSRAELERRSQRWHEPKVDAWWYCGSADGFHYIHHSDLGPGPRDFRIAETELAWRDRMPRRLGSKHWRALGRRPDWRAHVRSPRRG